MAMSTPRILNFGSLNVDHVYRVKTFVRPGETISALDYRVFPGGKGLNQSIALGRAGACCTHAGVLGQDGLFLRTLLEQEKVDCSLLRVKADMASGHAVIQVSEAGENCIVLYGGTNQAVDEAMVQDVLAHFSPGDCILLQNEISAMPAIMRLASRRGMRIFINPAPMNEAAMALPMELADTIIVNETEGAALASLPGTADPAAVMDALRRRLPAANILMTLGGSGSVRLDAATGELVSIPAARAAQVVDTTAAGDTYIGYYLALCAEGRPPRECMETAARAAAVCVSRAGAGVSIPHRSELQGAL